MVCVIFFFPGIFGALQQREGTHDIGASKFKRVCNAAVYMAFGGQVDDAVRSVCRKNVFHFAVIGHICLYEKVVGGVFYVFQIVRIGGVRELVYIDNQVLGIGVDE